MKKIVAAIAIVAALAIVGFGVWSLQNSPRSYAGKIESITLGTAPIELATLIFIAQDQGFFAENGLNITIKYYDSAVASVSGMVKDEADISVSTEYPIVVAAFRRENISLIGSVDKYQTTYLVGRKDRGIENISDLRGKKIGLTHGGIGEFYLGRFLYLNGMRLQDVTLMDIKPAELMGALTNGSIDAAMVYNIDINKVEAKSGGNMVIWPAQNHQATYGVVACKNSWAYSHQDAINRFLKSLDQAEDYSINHPIQAKMIVQKKINHDDAYVETIWPDHQFSLSLDQSLVLAIEDEGRWMINNDLTGEKTIPDFRGYIYTRGLEEAKPGSINIIG
jgi:NitT/TauT family transport system substrate-binding protein